MCIIMHDSWRPFLSSEWTKPYFIELSAFLKNAYESKRIYPPKNEVFSAFETDFNAVRVVILGQDPYHGAGQAHGLAFSVREDVALPPSLQNIYKEIKAEFNTRPPLSGNLDRWATQGVLLLNNTLTVEANKAGSHRNIGWEIFTAAVIAHLNEHRDHLVFMLWGRDARAKKPQLDPSRHLILEAAHPSPFSATYGFFGCNHFLRANAYLKSHNFAEITW
ncbi:MAG: uracil-DNA glycosylase [Kiritimatiellaeota bacterium]|nr:uracil-DNA glycosylase [Kiritimatiellota bacterium]